MLPGADAAVEPVGVALALLAGACYGVYTVSAKRLLDDGHDPVGVFAATLGAAALLLAPLLANAPSDLLQPGGVALIAWLGIAATAGAYLLFSRGLGSTPAATAGTLSLAEPLTAVALGLVILGERPTPATALGAALLLGGLAASALAPASGRTPLPDRALLAGGTARDPAGPERARRSSRSSGASARP